MACNRMLPHQRANCRMCCPAVHKSNGVNLNSGPQSRQLYVPLKTAQNGLICEQLKGALVYTQIGTPILHGGGTCREPVPIKIGVMNEPKEGSLFSNYQFELPKHTRVEENEMYSSSSRRNRYFSDSQRKLGHGTSQAPVNLHFAIPSCSYPYMCTPSAPFHHSEAVPMREHPVDNDHFCYGDPNEIRARKSETFKPNDRGDGKYNNSLQTGTEICHATYHVFAHNRDYYMDLKENNAGMYMKMIEIDRSLYPCVAVVGKILMRIHTVFDLRRHLHEFLVFFNTLNINPCEPNSVSILKGHPIKSEIIFSSNRRYYLDLVTNKKGSFLKIKQATIPNGSRSSLVVGAVGLRHFCEAFTDMLMKFVTGGVLIRSLPQPLEVNGDKELNNFYFDVGQNDGGVYMRISKIGEGKRVITVPMAGWKTFHDLFDFYIEEIKEWRNYNETGANRLREHLCVDEKDD